MRLCVNALLLHVLRQQFTLNEVIFGMLSDFLNVALLASVCLYTQYMLIAAPFKIIYHSRTRCSQV